jgi:hypothetical protein
VTRQELFEALKHHDWFYAYSDDHRVWKRGAAKNVELGNALNTQNCPFRMQDIRKAVQGMIVEEYLVDTDGTFYKQEYRDKGWNMYQPRRDEMITASERDKIIAWFDDT